MKRVILVALFILAGTVLWSFTVQLRAAGPDPVYPESDVNAGFANCVGTCAGHYDTLDEASYNATDYISTGTTSGGGEVEEYEMTSTTGATDVVTNIEVHIQAYADGGCQSDCDTLGVRVFIDGAYDGTTNTITLTGADAEYNNSNGGLSWSGTWSGDADLRIEITRNVQGSGNPNDRDDNVRIGRVYAGITYSPAPSQIAFTTAQRTLTAGACSGAGNVITIQLRDPSNNPANPSGATVVRITSNSPSETIYSDSSCTTELTNGDVSFSTVENTKSFYIVDTRKSNPTWTLSATQQSGPDTLSTANQNLTINAGVVSRLVVTLPGQSFTDGVGNSGSVSSQTAGSSFVITSISATDDYFNVNSSYTGSHTLAYSGPSASQAPSSTAPTYTTSVSFTNGQSTTALTTTLYRAETTTITVTDTGLYGYASSSVTVNTGILFDFSVVAATPITAGVCSVASNTIDAMDQWDNQRSTDTSVVNITTSGSGVTFYTDSGCGTPTSQYTLSGGTANFYYQTNLKQSGITITATKNLDTPTGTSGSVDVQPGVAAALLIRLPGQSFIDGTGIGGSPSFTGTRSPNATAGASFTIDIKAIDAYNNLVDSGVNNYNGNKTISYADSVAGNAPSGQSPGFPSTTVNFTNGEANGLTVTYYNATTGRTFEADDTGTPVSGTASSGFTVQAGVADNYDVTASTPQIAGVAFNATITARDTWNNALGSLYSPPAGSYNLTTTNGNAPDGTSPSVGTLVQGDFTNGVATKSITLYNATSSTITASDPSATVSGTSGSTTVNPGNISADVSDSTITGNSSVVRDTPLTVTITLRDTWRNPISGVLAANIVVNGTSSPSITQPSSNTDGSGQTTADLTWSSAGNQTVSVQINSVSLVQNDGSTADADGFLDNTHDVSVSLPPGGSSTIQGGVRIQGGARIQ